MLFGPAYKGIPIAVSTSMALGMMGSDVSFAFNRKERKTTVREETYWSRH